MWRMKVERVWRFIEGLRVSGVVEVSSGFQMKSFI